MRNKYKPQPNFENRIFINLATFKDTPTQSQSERDKTVAGYTRVSDGKESMLHSLSAQISYYSEMIQNRRDWQYAGVYIDKSVTGTKDNRAEFQKMIKDCKNGKIDMIITKSISRFARNTVTMLETVRELKSLGIDVYFEKENIHSMSGDGELMLTILSSFAQEESLSVSENCKWRLRDKYKEGIPNNFKIYGYNLENGKLVIIPKEAEIVKMIFRDYLSGMGKNAIVRKLSSLKIDSKFKKSWHENVVDTILRNEKYVGDMLLQKFYSSNHIEKKKCVNTGELPKYFISNSHDPIIDRETFEKAQNELKRRSKRSIKPRKDHIFTGKIICKICGAPYKHKTNNAGTKYAKSVWICGTFNSKGKAFCSSSQIPEDILKSVTAEILQISKFDKKIFNNKVQMIEVPQKGSLNFILYDGTQIHKTWKY